MPLKSGGPSRIVTTASNAHLGAKISFDDLLAGRKYSAMGAYATSKLANVLFTRALAKRLEGTGVTATCVHPGFVRTNFGHDNEISPLLRDPQVDCAFRAHAGKRRGDRGVPRDLAGG